MSATAWLFLALVWGIILINTGYCFYRLLASERQLGGDD